MSSLKNQFGAFMSDRAMVFCQNCGRDVLGVRPHDHALSCYLCGRILETYNYCTRLIIFKNAAGEFICRCKETKAAGTSNDKACEVAMKDKADCDKVVAGLECLEIEGDKTERDGMDWA